MGLMEMKFQVWLFAILCVLASGKPLKKRPIEYEPDISQYQGLIPSTSRKPEIEVTTQYKYLDIIAPYTHPAPVVHSIRHAAGTYYYPVEPNENPDEKRMQVYEDVFQKPFEQPRLVRTPPPKY